MGTGEKNLNRRLFLKTAGSASLASLLASRAAAQTDDPNQNKSKDEKKKAEETPKVPRRKFGKSEIEVPMLSLGGMFDITQNQIVLIKALEWGVSYWDTANVYNGGKSELGIGIYLKKNPEMRENIFIVSKASGARDIVQVEEKLQLSLTRMNTPYIDLYYGVHGLRDPDQLNASLREWAMDAKKRGLIKYFGFSTHSNMAKCMTAAAELDYVDAIMTTYNFREMQNKEMQAAVEACSKAGIALIAMKTQAGGAAPETETEKKITGHFLGRGFTLPQAKLKAVWEDERFCCICSQMPNIRVLVQNIAAALDKSRLSLEDVEVLGDYARQTCGSYCAGCEEICAAASPDMPYVRDVMRYLMYHHNYGDTARARELYAQLPSVMRANMTGFDYSTAQARCPQGLAIAELIGEAARVLS